ncbi:MAG: ABC transporter substrate-binding protein [Oscillospiraceae bacterium]|nr:ABC transporter substrate-binding protein [Oscillospiraceae bacterium]
MRRCVVYIIVFAAVCALLSASGCFMGESEPAETPVEVAPPAEPAMPVAPENNADDRFTLRYDPEGTLNPFAVTNTDNVAVTSLMYEGLFALDESFEPVPVLCESYVSEGASYVFTVKKDVVMSDGGALTAEDVAYSLDRARDSGRYAERLSCIESVSVEEEGGGVSVELVSPNGRLAALLDVPIVRSGTGDGAVPPGSGPYVLTDGPGGGARLTVVQGYRDAARLPLSVIYLRGCTDSELVELFTEHSIDLYSSDPVGMSPINVHRDHEIRRYDSTTLQYLGFSSRRAVLDRYMRRAVGLAVDREYIVRTLMGGCALPAPLVLSPAHYAYDAQWEPSGVDAFLEISSIFSLLGLADSDNDVFLEYPEDGGHVPFTLDFIVNSENARKTAAARAICDSLRRVGLDVTLRELPWAQFLEALEAGDFDIYYGETTLSASFDISELALPGGKLDFGDVGSEGYAEYIDAFVSAESEAQFGVAARQLCERVADDAVIVPILYKQYEAHSDRNAISGMRPTQSSVFFSLTDWKVSERFALTEVRQ